MCYSSYLFKSCHRCRYRNQTVVSKVHTGLMTYENSRVSSRWGNSQWNFTATGISALFARLRVTYYSERYGCFFELFFSLSLFFFYVTNRHKNDGWHANTVANIIYCPVKNLKKKKKRGGEVERARFRKCWTKRTRGKAVSKTEIVPLNLKCDSNWKRYVTLRTICIEWFRLPAENTETGHAIFKTRSSS